jgi:aldehyde:ferredoxin oxidoreductase
MSIYGYMGRLLFVNLTDKTYRELALPKDVYREYIGGYGLGVRFLYEHMKPGVDPLGPDNIIGFITGPLVGTKSHGAGRFTVVGKSPLTGGWGDANCGGKFGPALKRTGYDGVFVTGRAETPVYLLITDQKVEFRDASHLWSRDTLETEKTIKKEAGGSLKVISIGQAGEKLSRIASIMHDHGRAAGRSGLGAVMGSKKIKSCCR